MKLCILLVLICLWVVYCGPNHNHNHANESNYKDFPPDKYTAYTYQPGPPLRISDLPHEFSWRDVQGENLLSPNWNQHIPRYCGACWIHGSLSAVNDRIKIANRGRYVPDIMLARQVIVNCGEKRGGFGKGCGGGESYDVFQYMHEFGLPDETCNNYAAEGTPTCDAEAICMNCMYMGGDTEAHCWPIPEEQVVRYYVTEYGDLSGEAAMMTEIIRNGPITCGMTTPDDFCYGYHGGVWHDESGDKDVDHDVEVVGWGVEDGKDYWLIRNSWGSYWGENGFFKLERGVNSMQIESNCVAATVDVHELHDLLDGKVTGSMYGVIPMDQKPEYYPHHWTRDPHHWKDGAKAGYKLEEATNKRLNKVWNEEEQERARKESAIAQHKNAHLARSHKVADPSSPVAASAVSQSSFSHSLLMIIFGALLTAACGAVWMRVQKRRMQQEYHRL